MEAEDLERTWSHLAVPLPPAELSGLRVPGLQPNLRIYVALDSSERRHLLIEVPRSTESLKYHATRGLEVSTENLRIGQSPEATYIDLTCLDPLQNQTFTAVSLDIITAISSALMDPREAVISSLDRWRWFWSLDPNGLTREEALGLFGELWFLYRWVGPVSSSTLNCWHGPLGARHDFQWDVSSVEVKTTSIASGNPVHRIASIDQLDDPDTGMLYLFSLQVWDDPLSANTLPALVSRIAISLSNDPASSLLFNERLAQAGYNPAMGERYSRPLRIIAEELYKVEGAFPRLTRKSFINGLPPGIENISYSLSVSVCIPWRVAISPSDLENSFQRGT